MKRIPAIILLALAIWGLVEVSKAVGRSLSDAASRTNAVIEKVSA